MKFRNLFFISIALLLSFNSCKKDDVDLIVGTWKYNTMELELESTDVVAATAIKTGFELAKNLINMSVTFNEDGTFSSTTYSLLGDSETYTGEYSISGGKLIMEGESVNYELSKKSLKLKVSGEDFVGDFMDEDDIDFSTIKKFEVSVNFDKK